MSDLSDDMPFAEGTARHAELSNALVRDIIHALDNDHDHIVRDLCATLQSQDQAELLNQISTGQREQLIAVLGDGLAEDVLAWLDEDAAEDVINALGHEKAAAALSNLERDDALHLLKDLSEEDQQVLLDSMQEETRQDLAQGFAYPEESAGRLMQKQFVSIPEFWTIGNVIDYLRTQDEDALPEHFYVIYVVDHRFHPKGLIPLSRVMKCSRETRVEEAMTTNLHVQQTDTDQEEVAHIFRKYGLVEAPVVNADQRLVGTITVDDVVFVMQKEGEEDFLKSAGLNSQDLYYSLYESVKTRFPWLFVNLLTAIAASFVIGMFEAALQKLVILAVLMPIIASMGGNAGIQSATIAVRALATRKLASGNIMYMVRKEMMLGALNGIGLALITGVGVWIVYGDIHVAGIFAAATVITMIVAGFSGAALPFVLQRFGVDPAISSGVFLTMLTDILSFFTFLGLATWLLG
jgi:magnesium transporter